MTSVFSKFRVRTSLFGLLCAFLSLPALAAWQPGLQWGKISNVSTLQKNGFPAVTNIDLTTSFANTQSGWGGNTTYVYWGEIFLDGSSYRFGENIDDAIFLKINDTIVLNDSSWNGATFGTVSLPVGWYPFELRIHNTGGGAGAVAGSGFTATKGFAYLSGLTPEAANAINSGTDLSILQDPGNGTLFHYDDGLGFNDTLTISGEPSPFGTVSPNYGVINNLSAEDSFLCSVSSLVTTNANGCVYTYNGYEIREIDIYDAHKETVIASGDSSVTSVTYTYSGKAAKLVWLWDFSGYVIAPFTSAPDRGTVSDTATYAEGVTATITATPVAGCSFLAWRGTLPENADPSSPTLTFTVDRAYSPEAVFSANYYVSNDAASPTPPYSSWETAAPTLEDAVNLAKSFGDSPATIYIANGTYPLTETVELTSNISIVGESRDGVVITGGLLPQTRAFTMNPLSSIKSVTVDGCTNFVAGTGIYMYGGTLDDVRITRMRQSGGGNPPDGAGLYMKDGLVKNCFIDRNYIAAGYHGSNGIGIRMTGGLVVDSTICSNKMDRTQHGGLGICMTGGTVRRCRIFGNDSSACGAGNYGIEQGCAGHGVAINGASAVLEDSYIYENGKNGVFIYNGTARNCVVYGHYVSGNHCAGVYLSGGRLLNSTIYGNTSAADAEGLSGLYMVGGTAINNIIYGNGNPALGSARVTNGNFATNLTDVAISGSLDCAVGNPYFVDPANHDFHLQGKMSLAVDSGCPLPEITADIEGLSRPQGKGIDMGAFEYLPGTDKTVSVITTSGSAIKSGDSFFATAETENIDEESATFTWTLSLGDTPVYTTSGIGASFASFSREITDNGLYMLTLSVTPDGEEPIPSANELSFEVKPLKVYVSQSGSATHPFDTPETATPSLNDAFNAVFRSLDDHAEIVVAEGSYALNASIPLATPISIIGAGSDRVIVNGSALSENERAFTLSHDDAYLGGITIEGCTNRVDGAGYCIRIEKGTLTDTIIQYNTLVVGSYGTGGALTITGGIVTNCIIRKNWINASSHSTKGVGVRMIDGLITDSVISDNFLKKDECDGVGFYFIGGTARRLDIFGNKSGGGDSRDNARGGGIYMNGGTLEYSRIHHNFNGIFMNDGTIKNCLIYGNTWKRSLFAGLSQQNGTVINCTIADNICEGDDTKSDLSKTGGTTKNTIAVKAKVTGGSANNNLFNEEPCFRPLKKYHLSKNSPAIDAGDNSAAAGDVDLDGNPRIHPIKNIIDIGCYESAMPSTTLILLR